MNRPRPPLGHRLVALAVVLVAGLGASLVVPSPVGASGWGHVELFDDEEIRTPMDIATGPDGNLWFTNASAPSITRVTSSGVLTHFSLVGQGLDVPEDITAGPGASMYFTSRASNAIGRITTTTNAITSFTHPELAAPLGITTGPDGNVWFTSSNNDRIGRLTPQGITMFDDPEISFPMDIAAGPDGNLWFTMTGGLGRITLAGEITVFVEPALENPVAITTGPDGALWIGDTNADLIGRFTMDGLLQTFEGPDMTGPSDIVVGPDGNLWFVTDSDNLVGSITTAGEITTFDGAPQDESGDEQRLSGIATGPDDDVWFTARTGDYVARVRVCSGGVFSDVSLTHPFRADVCWMGVEEISTGYDDGTYRPSAAVSRQAMSAFMYRLAGEPPFSAPGSPTFSDVGSGHPFFAEVEWMADSEISEGYPDGTYRPSAAVTRQAMSAFMYRLAGEPPFSAPGSPTFSDVGSGHPFFAEVEWMVDAEISTGYVDGTYRPSAAVSRQAMSAFMRRLADGPGVGAA